jgi:hypothetical protein
MAKKETLEQFANNLHKFSPLIVKAVLKDWQNYTEESFADSQEKVPILTGDLLRSGNFKKATITPKGIESKIVYTMPYAQVIESGERNGKPIELKPQGFEYSHATKARQGQTKYLSSSVEDNTPNVIKDIMDSIGKAWDKI